MGVDFGAKPLPIHVPFHRSPAIERMLFGAVGSGKSYALVDEAIAWCLEQPGIRGLITRRTVPELRDSTEAAFFERLPHELYAAGDIRRSGGHVERFVFPNGSVVLFRAVDDWRKYKSYNLGFIALDECNEFDEETYLGLRTRLRQRDITKEARDFGYGGQVTRRGIWGASNPEGHDWCWRRFHPESKERLDGTACFTSTTLDNPYLPPEYIQGLLQYPKPWVQRYVLCQFDDFAGRIYDEWSHVTHVVPHPVFEPGTQPLVWMGMDPGTQNPTAGLWAWIDKENRRLVGIAEYEQAGVAVDIHAREWRAIEAAQQMNVRWRVADPNSVTQRDRGSAIPLNVLYQKLGFNFNLGASREPDRIPVLGHLIHLRRFVVSERCVKTYEAIRDYQWEDLTPARRTAGQDPKERPLKRNTHLVECAQYLAGREAPAPKLALQEMRNRSFNDEITGAIRKNLRDKARRVGAAHDLGSIRV